GLHHLITDKPIPTEKKPEQLEKEPQNGSKSISSIPSDLEQTNKDVEKNFVKLKNTKALDTLLALARTYIDMHDIESALHSLNEVIEHGSKVQKKEAKRLLDEIERK
ncbi:MAG: fimbrial protein FimV, partial [Legionella longbeachae]|nr:fimbrial protein FimV [Legionella longbeachae]